MAYPKLPMRIFCASFEFCKITTVFCEVLLDSLPSGYTETNGEQLRSRLHNWVVTRLSASSCFLFPFSPTTLRLDIYELAGMKGGYLRPSFFVIYRTNSLRAPHVEPHEPVDDTGSEHHSTDQFPLISARIMIKNVQQAHRVQRSSLPAF
jgi:hypothetical protein